MKKLFALMATTTAFCLGGGVATAAEVPTYELMGFPITPHQFSVVGSAYVQERSPTPTLTPAGMPASPHQIAVLTPRSSTQASGSPSSLQYAGARGGKGGFR
jgi:hypothetical protein